MGADEIEARELHATALKNAETILIARQRAERELIETKEALERTTQELRIQREWFQVTLSSIGDAVIATDLLGNVTFLNPVAESMTGWTAAQAQGAPLEQVFRIVNEHTLAPAENPVSQVLKSGRIIGLANHTALIRRDGTVVSVEDSAAPIRDAQNNVSGAVMVFHDVTQQRRAERVLHASAERLRATFNQAAVGIGISDLNHRFVEVNQQFCDIVGYSRDELLGKKFTELTDPADLPETQIQAQRVLAGKIPHYILEKRYVRKGGDAVWCRSTVTVLRDAAGVVEQYIGIVENITERMQADEAVRDARARLELALRAAQIGAWQWDIQNDRLTFDRNAGVFVAKPNADGDSSQGYLDSVHPDDRPRVQAAISRALASENGNYEVDYRLSHHADPCLWVVARGNVQRDAERRATHLRGVVIDITDRKQAEETMRDATRRLQLSATAGNLGEWSWDAQTDLMTLGPRACEIFGLPLDVCITRAQMRDRLLQTEGERARIALERSLANRSDYDIEYHIVQPSGQRCWVATRGRGIYADDGTVTGMVGVVQDITARKQDEEARSRLAAVVQSSDDAILSKTLDGVITTWNLGAQRMFGYTADEIVGKSVTVLIPPDHIDEEPIILQRLRRGERIDHYETTRMRKDGTFLEVSLTVSPIIDASGAIIGASKIARDISQRKRSEKAMREYTGVLEALNATGRSIAAELDLHSLVQNVTDAATQLSGARFGAFFEKVTDPQGESYRLRSLSGAPREAFENFTMFGNAPIFDPTFRGDGPVRCADVSKDPRFGTSSPHHGLPMAQMPLRSYLAVPVVSRSGAVTGGLFFGHPEPDVFTERAERLVVGVAAQAAIAIDNSRLYESAQREIASRERAEAALRDTDRRKDEFLATLAHELRNPLAPIRQAALISKAPGATDAQKRWSHDVISRQVQHMALLLDDLLDISRITRGTLRLRTEMTELAAVVDAAVETARPSLDAKRHVFSIEMSQEPLRFAADPLRLAQVLANLLTNAAKYTDPEGRILLRASRKAETIVISVADNGIGIPPDSLGLLFSMFSQVRSAQDRSEGGLGIGLALAKGLVELHGGTIEAASPGPGRGSEFTVRLPFRSLGDARPRDEGDPELPATPGRRVLIADDNSDGAESLAVLLRMEGHDVTVVKDGRAALAAFDACSPEVAILDIGMPELDGYEVARRVRERAPGRAVTLIAVTGWGQDRDKARALAAGFNHHLTKPVRPERMSELIRLFSP